jgi:hypothetical protein
MHGLPHAQPNRENGKDKDLDLSQYDVIMFDAAQAPIAALDYWPQTMARWR